MKPPIPVRGYRLDQDTVTLLAALAKKLGVSNTDVVRLAIRQMAEKEGLR